MWNACLKNMWITNAKNLSKRLQLFNFQIEFYNNYFKKCHLNLIFLINLHTITLLLPDFHGYYIWNVTPNEQTIWILESDCNTKRYSCQLNQQYNMAITNSNIATTFNFSCNQAVCDYALGKMNGHRVIRNSDNFRENYVN